LPGYSATRAPNPSAEPPSNSPSGPIPPQAAQNIERRLLEDLPGNREAAAALGLAMEQLHGYYTRRQIDQFVESIRIATARATRIVANMLQFNRQSSPVAHPAPLAELMDQAVELAANDYDLKKRFDFRGIRIVREFDPSLPPVPVVAVEIEQVLLNLIRNAAQAMAANPPERPPCITLRLKRDGEHAIMEVEDNGPGIAESIRHRVFEPFFTTKEPGIGTGLGLSVSYMIIVNNHRGIITVDAAPGAGARFTIRLPQQ
jgi:signal transduction histidine kinase